MILLSFECIHPAISCVQPSAVQRTTAARNARLVRTESQKKCIAARAADTRARNKAAKAAKANPNSSTLSPPTSSGDQLLPNQSTSHPSLDGLVSNQDTGTSQPPPVPPTLKSEPSASPSFLPQPPPPERASTPTRKFKRSASSDQKPTGANQSMLSRTLILFPNDWF